jgi:lactate dehydrogenase-like 2-hydroxyacid dehydrogenase
MGRILQIVRLDGIISPPPTFSPDFHHTYTSYDQTPFDHALITSRIQDADVVISTRIPLSASTIAASPKLKLVAVFAIGCDHIDLAACKERGITVCNVPAASNESVAEHAIALYFALRRKIVGMHELTVEGEEWFKTGSLAPTFGERPGTCREEVMGIFGAGELGSSSSHAAVI